MNRIAKSICMIAVIALAFTACKKNDTDTKTLQFKGSTEAMMVVDDEFGEKVYMDGNNRIQFEAGDYVSIFNVVNADGTGSQCALFEVVTPANWSHVSGPIDESHTTGAYYAYYPGGDSYVNATQLTNKNRVKFTLWPTQQDRRDGDNKPMIPSESLYAAAVDSIHNLNDAWFNFKNICGILSLKLYSPSGKTVTSIAVTDRRYNLVGDVTLKINEVSPTYMTTLFRNYNENNADYMTELNAYLNRIGYSVTGNIGNTVTLNCGNGITLGTTKAKATEFYIVLRPLALIKGCDIQVNFTSGAPYPIHSTKNNCIGPNVIKKMAAVNVG